MAIGGVTVVAVALAATAPTPDAAPPSAAPGPVPARPAPASPSLKTPAPGVWPRVEIRPYVPPVLGPDPDPAPVEVAAVIAPAEREMVVVARPAPGAPIIGSAPAGTRVAVRGAYEAASPAGCASRRWYALAPRGWVCAGWVRRTDGAPATEPVLRVAEGKSLPYAYVMVRPAKEPVHLWASMDDVKAGAPPLLPLKKGDTIAVAPRPSVRVEGERYHVAEDGRAVPVRHTFRMGEVSAFHGVALGGEATLPFAWVTPATARVYDSASADAQSLDSVARRTRVPLLDDAGTGAARRVRIGEGRWLRAADVNEVRPLPRPESTRGHARWIDVDLGEQVLVAYEDDRPVFATLVSSGRAMPTPRGSYPIWAKVSFITMKNQPYEDQTYYVDRVPWVMFFQAHNAIHGAYWHDRFGVRKSHGCINVSPRDARWLFEWVPPDLPVAWSGARAPNLLEAPTVHVRNSHLRRALVQERSVGPPDREEERLKLEEVEAQRAEAAALAP